MVNEGEDQHGHVDPEVVNHVEDQPEHIDSEPNQTTGELFFKRHSGIIVLAVAALAFANFVIKDIFGDQAKEIADSVTAAEAVFIIRQDLGSINEKITGIANAARLLVANDAERERSSRKPSDEKTRGVGKGLPTLKRKNENDREAVTLVEFAMLDLGFQEQRRRISLVTLDNIAQLAKSFTDPKLEKQLSSVRAELEHYDRGYKDLRQNHSLDDMGVLNATSQLGQDLTFVSLNLGILQGKALDGAKKAEATADSRYRLFRNIGYGLYGLVAVIIVVGKHYKYDWHRQMQDTDTNQHYVSQFLLRGFHTENEAQIWAFDKLTDRSFTTAIDRVASEHGFYNIAGSAEIDDVIRKFEDATAPIVEEIRTRKSLRTLNEYKRIWLSGFTALQYVRTRGFSERSQDMMKQITDVVKQIGSGNLSKKLRRQLGLDAPGSEHEKTLSTILGLVRPVADELLEKTCVLYRSDGALPFWIGDSPVTMHNTINPGDGLRSTLGFGVPGIEVYLPISSELVLAHMCPTIAVAYGGVDEQARRMGFIHAHARPYLQALENGTPILLSKEHVQFQNWLQLGYAERFIYSSTDSFEDARKILEETPKLRTGRRTGKVSPANTP